jgi:radical SAM protein with 4Fe4S-binding SPASM domain
MTGQEYARKVSRATFSLLKGKHPLLGHLDIELTERCNNRCIHCLINLPADDREAEAREMDTAFVLGLLRQAADLGCMSVRFTGGEPLLRPDLPELYLAARRLGMQVILFTNARLITPDFASLLARVPPGRVVEVTVYGMHPASYDAVAGVKGAFGEFRRGVDLLLSHHIPFVVKQAVLPQNRHEMAEFEAWAASLPSMDQRPRYSMNFDLRARHDDPAKNKRIAALRLSPSETVAVLAQSPGYKAGMQVFCSKFMRPAGEAIFSCGAGHGTCIDAYGNAQMCLPLRHRESVFDLHEGTLKEALNEFFPRFRERKAENPAYLRRCAVCFLKGLCEQCPAKSWMESGTLDTPVEYLCEVAHAQARYLGLVGESEKAWEVTDGKARVERFAAGTTEPAGDKNAG